MKHIWKICALLAAALLLCVALAEGDFSYNYEHWTFDGEEWIYIGEDPEGEGLNPPPLPGFEEEDAMLEEVSARQSRQQESKEADGSVEWDDGDWADEYPADDWEEELPAKKPEASDEAADDWGEELPAKKPEASDEAADDWGEELPAKKSEASDEAADDWGEELPAKKPEVSDEAADDGAEGDAQSPASTPAPASEQIQSDPAAAEGEAPEVTQPPIVSPEKPVWEDEEASEEGAEEDPVTIAPVDPVGGEPETGVEPPKAEEGIRDAVREDDVGDSDEETGDELAVSIYPWYAQDAPAVGDQVTLISEVSGASGAQLFYQWQFREPGGEWRDVPGANAESYTYIIDEENSSWSWRLRVEE